MELLFGHPVIPADTPGLPALDVPTTGRALPDELRQLLADLANEYAAEQGGQLSAAARDVVSLWLHDESDIVSGADYVAAEAEITDAEGGRWNHTFTVVEIDSAGTGE